MSGERISICFAMNLFTYGSQLFLLALLKRSDSANPKELIAGRRSVAQRSGNT